MQQQASVTRIEELAPQVLQVTVTLAHTPFQFVPGQWVNFRFPEGVSRAYAIASAPEKPDLVEICVRTGSGKGAEALRALKPGAAVAIDGPFGHFILPQSGAPGVVFLAGDTGIAPVRSIVLHMVARDDPRRIVVLYEPDRKYILYASDFDPLAREGVIRHESGPIETLISRNREALAESVVMAAGFQPFLDRVRESLSMIGVDPAVAIQESFGQQP